MIDWHVRCLYQRASGNWAQVIVKSNGFVSAIQIDGTTSDVSDITLTQQNQTDLFARWDTVMGEGVGSLAEKVGDFHAKGIQGPRASLPTPGQPGGDERFFVATDTPGVFRDNGTLWECVLGSDDDATIPSQRSLGATPTQAAPKTHTHS